MLCGVLNTIADLLIPVCVINSSHEALIRSFQLAFSLRKIALTGGGSLLPSSRRSLFTLATSIILFSSKAYNILPLVKYTRETLTEKNVDSFLCLVGDHKLQVIKKEADHKKTDFGSEEDDRLALKFLSEIDTTQDQKGEIFASEIVHSLENMSDVLLCEPSELFSVKEQLLIEFLPDDVCPLGAQFMDTPNKVYLVDSNSTKSMKETALISLEDDGFLDSVESQGNVNTELAVGMPQLLSVNQILESLCFLYFFHSAIALQFYFLCFFFHYKSITSTTGPG